MKAIRVLLGLGLAIPAISAVAQSDHKLHFGGSFEEFFATAGFGDITKSRDRWSMLTLNATMGKWRAQASYWYYPFCTWYELDDSGVTFEDGTFRAQIGRFRLPVGQSDWYDQWYEGFVNLPIIEYTRYDNAQPLERTSVGIEAEQTFGPHTLKAAATSAEPEYNRLTPDRLDRLSGRWSYYQDSFILGVSGFVDTARHEGYQAQMMSADARWTAPNWIIRGQEVWYDSDNQKQDGWFVDVSHRPKGWTDVTLVGRYEQVNVQKPFAANFQAWTLGARLRLPYEITAQANYTGGPDMNAIFFGGGWSLGLYKMFSF